MATILSRVGTFRSFHEVAHNSKRSVIKDEPNKLSNTPLKSLLIIWFYVGISKIFNRRVLEKRHFERGGEEKIEKSNNKTFEGFSCLQMAFVPSLIESS